MFSLGDVYALKTGDQLLEMFREMSRTHYLAGVTTVGMVGYPNVGKSSTINAIMQCKKVPVSATPGRTKHFQVLEMLLIPIGSYCQNVAKGCPTTSLMVEATQQPGKYHFKLKI